MNPAVTLALITDLYAQVMALQQENVELRKLVAPVAENGARQPDPVDA